VKTQTVLEITALNSGYGDQPDAQDVSFAWPMARWLD